MTTDRVRAPADVAVFWSPVRKGTVDDIPVPERDRWLALRQLADRDRLATASALRRKALTAMGAGRPDLRRRCGGCGSERHGAVHAVDRADRVWTTSTSHTGDVVMVAVGVPARGRGVRLGIDVEEVSRVPRAAITLVCTPGEARLLTEGCRRPVDLWSAKEAVLKAAGCGLHLPASGVDLAARRSGHDWRSAEISRLLEHPRGVFSEWKDAGIGRRDLHATCFVDAAAGPPPLPVLLVA